MKAYKVVRYDSGKYTSHSGIHSLEYNLGVKTVPTFGRIFVFKNQKKAEIFARGHKNAAILEGEAEDCRIAFIGSAHPCRDQFFWEMKKRHKKPSCQVIILPKGSYTCTSFTPERMVSFSS